MKQCIMGLLGGRVGKSCYFGYIDYYNAPMITFSPGLRPPGLGLIFFFIFVSFGADDNASGVSARTASRHLTYSNLVR